MKLVRYSYMVIFVMVSEVGVMVSEVGAEVCATYTVWERGTSQSTDVS